MSKFLDLDGLTYYTKKLHSKTASWGSVTAVTWDRVKSWVRDGTAAKYLKVGDQLSIPYSYGGKDYTYILDVWHHFDGSDSTSHADASYIGPDGNVTHGHAMVLGSHYCTPQEVPMCSQEAFFVPSVAMAPGTYNFTVNFYEDDEYDSATYQFTMTKAITENPSNYQFVWNGYYFSNITQVSIYSSWNSTTPVETCAVTAGNGGTAIGTVSELPATSTNHGYFNNIQRACYGSNNWETSSGRSWLNSTDTVWHDSFINRFHRISSLEGKPGFLSGFNASFLNSVVQKVNITIPHPIDTNNAYGTSTTHDRCWMISAREHNFSNYLSNTDEGYKAEGIVLDYWKNLASYNNHDIWNGWATYGELRTYELGNTTQSRDVFFRSANRNGVDAADLFGLVYAVGHVGSYSASYGLRAQPAFLIA
jgi:hypothetical protein